MTENQTDKQDCDQDCEMKMTLEEECADVRKNIKVLGDYLKTFRKDSCFNCDESYEGKHSEMLANITLAYRHLEDARMRVGKIMQAIQGGVSILDKR